jgi:tetratricopeptide (TPR) repeat protein
LPQAVVILFFPNEQNRRGLQSIVSQIRSEAKGPLKKKIDLHFVMSNVPYLDDEEEILEGELQRFAESLDFPFPSAVIHHYDSLALLEQETFNITHPRSRLAKEYADLTTAVVRVNLEDRLGALAFLDQIRRQSRRGSIVPDLEAQLQEIRLKHANDIEVLEKLADTRARQRNSGEALAILTQALKTGSKGPEILLRRAQLYFSLDQKDKVVADLKEILNSNDATSFDLTVVIRMLREVQPDLVQLISRSPVLDRIDSDIDLIRELQTSPETLSLAVLLLNRWLPTLIKDEEMYQGFRTELLLCLIGKGSYAEAIDVFGTERKAPTELKLPNLFNYAMALWGLEGDPPIGYLQEIAKYTQYHLDRQDPNHLQCLSLVNYLLGYVSAAEELLDKACDVNLTRGASSFSCWSYLKVSVERFASDLEEMNSAFKANQVIPEFIRRNSPMPPKLPNFENAKL